MTFYRIFTVCAFCLIFSGISLQRSAFAETKVEKSQPTPAAQAELRKRVDELQSAMANLGTTLSTQASDSTANIKTDVQKQLVELGRQLK